MNHSSATADRIERESYSHPMHRTITVNVERHYEDGRLDRIITDYTRGDKTIRVIDFNTHASVGRNNAILVQLGTGLASRSFKYASNAKETAIRLLL